jgi:hypothetical protein
VRLRGFGYAETKPSPAATVKTTARVVDLDDQRSALLALRSVVQPDVVHPLVREVALQAVGPCASRGDICELQAIFDLVKNGRPDISGFERGFKYVADPNWSDLFTAPHKTIELLRSGINGGDCDDHAALICALGGSIGFTMGLLAYGPPGAEGFTHVLAVAKFPKRDGKQLVGLDTTVSTSTVGWLPPFIPPKQDRNGRSANVLVTWLL